jgi:hypothetical protein
MWHAWERNVYRVLVGKPEGKRTLGRPRRRWEGGIRMDRVRGIDWIQLAQDKYWWRVLVNGDELACSGTDFVGNQ